MRHRKRIVRPLRSLVYNEWFNPRAALALARGLLCSAPPGPREGEMCDVRQATPSNAKQPQATERPGDAA